MTARVCVRCAAPDVVAHHPTGRLDGRYDDAGLVVDLCDACHGAEHAIRRPLDRCPTPSTAPERVALVLRRVAVTLGRLAGVAGLGPFLGGLAALLTRFADRLDSHVRALDAAVPGWREAVA